MAAPTTRTTPIPLGTLREQISQAISGSVKALDVPAACVRLGIREKVEETDAQETFGSKRICVRTRILPWHEQELLALATAVRREYASEDLADTISEMTAFQDSGVRYRRKKIPRTVQKISIISFLGQ